MPRKLYVGNLTPEITEKDLECLFQEYGEIHNIHIVRDKESDSPLGYGFVEMDAGQANFARKELNGRILKGVSIIVNNARMRRISAAKNERPRGRKKHSW